MNVNLIDAHIHLDGYKNHKQIYIEFNEFKVYALCVTNSPEIFKACMDNYYTTKYIKFALGFHPKLVGNKIFNLKEFMFLSNQTEYIGEVGLDFGKKNIKFKNQQIEIFKQILELASKSNKILSIHSNKAVKDVIKILSIYKPKRFIMHWFSGTTQEAKELVSLGAYFSINFDQVSQPIISNIPTDRLFIESDGPNGKKYKNKFNVKNLIKEYKNTSEILKIDNLEKVIFDNYQRLLQIK